MRTSELLTASEATADAREAEAILEYAALKAKNRGKVGLPPLRSSALQAMQERRETTAVVFLDSAPCGPWCPIWEALGGRGAYTRAQ